MNQKKSEARKCFAAVAGALFLFGLTPAYAQRIIEDDAMDGMNYNMVVKRANRPAPMGMGGCEHGGHGMKGGAMGGCEQGGHGMGGHGMGGCDHGGMGGHGMKGGAMGGCEQGGHGMKGGAMGGCEHGGHGMGGHGMKGGAMGGCEHGGMGMKTAAPKTSAKLPMSVIEQLQKNGNNVFIIADNVTIVCDKKDCDHGMKPVAPKAAMGGCDHAGKGGAMGGCDHAGKGGKGECDHAGKGGKGECDHKDCDKNGKGCDMEAGKECDHKDCEKQAVKAAPAPVAKPAAAPAAVAKPAATPAPAANPAAAPAPADKPAAPAPAAPAAK